MTETPLTQSESAIRALLDDGDIDAALTCTLRAGPELLGFLNARLRNLEHAREAFAWLAEALWRGLGGFRADSSVRTWAYAIARNVACRYVDRELKARYEGVPLSTQS